jgi:hypothetical protein
MTIVSCGNLVPPNVCQGLIEDKEAVVVVRWIHAAGRFVAALPTDSKSASEEENEK